MFDILLVLQPQFYKAKINILLMSSVQSDFY
jgi:hypothetical protein